MSQDTVSSAVAALEDLRHHILTKTFVLDVHDGVVQVGIEGIAGFAEGLDTHCLKEFFKAGLNHLDTGEVILVGTRGIQRSL